MEPIFSTKITKIKGKEVFERDDTLVREIKLELFVNEKRVGALMATPVDQEALAIGYLMSENIIEKFSDVLSLKLLNDGMQVRIEAKVNEANWKESGWLFPNLFTRRNCLCCRNVSSRYVGWTCHRKSCK